MPTRIFKVLVGTILLFSALRFLSKPPEDTLKTEPSRSLSIPIGAGLGLFSGLTGTGGGIFLTPLLLFTHWATAKQAAAVSALFILTNSASGLLGNMTSTQQVPSFALPLAVAALLGGTVGSQLGSKHMPPTAIKRMLAVVLLIAGAKLLLTR